MKNLAKEIINEILNPASASKKLTKKEQTEQRARELSEKRRLEIIAKNSKQAK